MKKSTRQRTSIFIIFLTLLLVCPSIFFLVKATNNEVVSSGNNGNHYGNKGPTPTPTSILPTETPTQTITPTPILPTATPTPRPIPGGKRHFSSGWSGSNIKEGTIDPYDPSFGSSQIIELHLADPKGVSQADIIVFTDNQYTHVPLSLSSGTVTDGYWQGLWTVTDSYNYTYIESITVVNMDSIVSHVDMTLR